MKIGYACLTVGVPDTNMRSCRMRNADEMKLYEIIASNLAALDHILNYNIANGIKLFRISSDLIPFGSSPINTLRWWEAFEQQFESLGEKIKKYGIRVSMHPGQYTVLNSPDESIVNKAIKDLDYHAKVLGILRAGYDNKIILHIGGIYHDKSTATQRFIQNYSQLEDPVKQRLVIENDDKCYNISDVLTIGHKLKLPVVFDNLHHEINPPELYKSEEFWINECRKTWSKKDGVQKIHYAQQEPGKNPGSHSGSIRMNEFMEFYKKLGRDDIDIMLEVKDKNLSAVKCINNLD